MLVFHSLSIRYPDDRNTRDYTAHCTVFAQVKPGEFCGIFNLEFMSIGAKTEGTGEHTVGGSELINLTSKEET